MEEIINPQLPLETEEEKSILSQYKVNIEVFDGPFDLMISMIDKGDIDIYNVSLAKIVQGFLEYIKTMQEYNMMLAGEFLVMAAYLIELKSKMLLPQSPKIEEVEDLAQVEEELIQRLAEYKIYKGLAESLRQRKDVFQKVYTRYAPEEALKDREFFLVDVSLKDLVSAFKRVYEMAEKREDTKEIIQESFSVKEKIVEIIAKIKGNPNGISFDSLFTRFIKLEIIVTFLAMLELIKQKQVKIMQDQSFSAIRIFWAGNETNG